MLEKENRETSKAQSFQPDKTFTMNIFILQQIQGKKQEIGLEFEALGPVFVFVIPLHKIDNIHVFTGHFNVFGLKNDAC